MERYDVIVVGAGLAGLVAATEAAERGFSVCVVDQEGEQNLGGQAFWSLGGLFFVDSPEQRRMRVRDSIDLARQDWFGSAGFDRPEDYWPRRWAEAYLDFAAGEKREWLHRMGMRWFPVVGWAERGGSLAHGHGNSVPRFHVTWGTGPGVLAPFVKKAKAMAATGRLTFRFRHRVDRLEVADGRVTGISGAVLAADPVQRGQESSREEQGDFTFSAATVIVSSGGIGGNQELVRRNWPVERLGEPPASMVCGVPAHVDGRMIAITETAGGAVINRDRMWHYTEGVKNHDPIWPGHGIRILPGPSSFWCDADGNRLAAPAMPGFDTLGTLKMLGERGSGHSWFILTKVIIKKEFALSGSEQNPDLTGKDIPLLLKRLGKEPPGPVRAFMECGEDFAVRDTLEELVAAMNAISGDNRLHIDHIRRQIEARDREIENGFSKDAQVTAIHGARRYLGDRLMRTAKPHRLLDPSMGPLIAVRLHVLTRKTLGGLHTDLEARVLDAAGEPVPGLYAAGEVAGFGGGGMHGYNALEGTFLGGCLFSGRIAGRSVLA
ncbi:FAD-binding dehydrogenase [Agrobacterium radiobacter]|jgi:predicted oxidoreductase|uniref:Putative enzyme n=1 Tax=Agrobacterium tumefaciens str. B6 TaxID=1183423 RepID=A0A822V9F0_AGRTU|nr:FAD-binding dehydrogenase [Agrobacterium tumefaciens]KWT88273.1 FAD-binding dehydrogenase [Agrobacterium tumefaciens str. B6]MQB24900.1 FAD-binding dehydrogenase [Agrobacterium tumefaciens]NTA07167.1 FAD-binding dehydrogenase [Agrobacterium tumefaciens]NTA93608.1 FAD-binding dehydrogenase [Agrobacterium tumefaciens]NTB14814.1 FAD-binding dehydrogenase [Agrobacterium tumefaciens]